MLRCVVIGDLHLGRLKRYFEDKPNELVGRAMAVPLEYARRENIKHVFLIGDIFDSPDPSDEELTYFVFLLVLYPDLFFHIIPGNHDTQQINVTSLNFLMWLQRKLKPLKNVRFYSGIKQKMIEGVSVVFMPWPHHVKPEELPPSLVVAHVTLNDSVAANGHKIRSSVKIEPGKDYWVIGDVHKYQTFNRILYPGTLYQLDFGEKLPKGFVSLQAKASKKSGKIIVDYEFHAVDPPFQLNTVVIESAAQLAKIPSDPMKKYILRVMEDIAIPENFRAEHPNCEIKPFDKKTAILDNVDLTDRLVLQSKKTGKLVVSNLKSYLVKQGLSKEKTDKAYSIVQEIVTSLKAKKEK